MKVKHLIIGGGFAGLYLANMLEDATIVEASAKLGGLLRGFKSPSQQFTFDIGGHVYTSKFPPLSELMEASDAQFFDHRLAYYDYQKQIPYPIQYHNEELGVPITTNSHLSYVSFGAMLIHEFGEEFYSKVMKPFNMRVWSTNPNAMSVDWVMGRVALMNHKSSSWGSNSSFFYARGEDIMETLINRMCEINALFQTQLKSVDIQNKIAYVQCVSEKGYSGPIEYEKLFDTSGMMLRKSGRQLPYNHVLTIGVGLNRKLDMDFHWWYNEANSSSPIHRITLLSRYHPKLAPEGCDSLLLEIPTIMNDNDEIIRTSPAEYPIDGVVTMLHQAGFNYIETKDVEEVVSIKSKGYPIPILSHREHVAFARKELMAKQVYLVGRWGAHGYYNLDHIMEDVIATREASIGLSTDNYYWANYYYQTERRFLNANRN